MYHVTIRRAVDRMRSSGVRSARDPFEDAAIHAIQFVDKDEGWAVGDDGVDLALDRRRQGLGAAEDRHAGQPSRRALPEPVHRLGRRPDRNAGRRAVRRRDAQDDRRRHRSGKRSAPTCCPGCTSSASSTRRTASCAATAATRFPSGMFSTGDGGRTWKPVPGPRVPAGGPRTSTPTACTVCSPAPGRKLGTLAANGYNGRRTRSALRPHGARRADSGTPRRRRRSRSATAALVLISADGGSKWGFAEPRASRRRRWRTATSSASRSRARTSGSPGGRAASCCTARDDGKTWEVQKTEPRRARSTASLPRREHRLAGRRTRHHRAHDRRRQDVEGAAGRRPARRGAVPARARPEHAARNDDRCSASATATSAPRSASCPPTRRRPTRSGPTTRPACGKRCGWPAAPVPRPSGRSRSPRTPTGCRRAT